MSHGHAESPVSSFALANLISCVVAVLGRWFPLQVALEQLSGLAEDKNNKEATRLFNRLLKQL
mgnify:CR=1 FL=1